MKVIVRARGQLVQTTPDDPPGRTGQAVPRDRPLSGTGAATAATQETTETDGGRTR